MPIKTAVIGVGSMGRNHARVYNELPQASLAAVADSNPESAQQAGQSFNVPWYSDYRQMLARERPQAVSIAVPTAQHEAVCLAAFDHGAHVLVEKPIAARLEESTRIIQASRQSNRLLMVGHIVRFNPAIQALQEKLRNGELGRIFQIISRRVGPFPERIRDVGVVIDLATHDLDLMRFLTGYDPLRLYAETEQRIHTAHEDLLLAVLRFPDHITAGLEINWLTPTKVREILVLGENGMLRVDDLTQDLYFYENASLNADPPPDHNILWPSLQNIKGVREGSMIRYALQRFEPLKAEITAFLTSLEQDGPVPVSGEDGLAALRLALALVESGRLHQVVELAPDA